MILRKPYAILIKYFRLIHFIMALFMGFLFYKTNTILSFFNEYTEKIATTIDKEITSSIFTPTLVISIVIILLASLIILYLMKFKDKPVKFYIYNILTYASLAVYFYINNNLFKSLEVGLVDVRNIKIMQDLALIVLLVQALAIIFVIVRTTGFDIKDFNFKKDLEELNIESKDSEEFEFQLEYDSDKTKRQFNRTIRHMKYVYYENKLLIHILSVILAVVILGLIYLDKTVYHKIYQTGEMINAIPFNLNVENSYHTKYDYKNTILNEKNELIVIPLKSKITYSGTQKLNSGSFYLDINGSKYHHVIDYKDRLQDIGQTYINQMIDNNFKTYLLVFEIPNGKVNKKMKLVYTDRTGKIYNISINPKSLNEKKLVKDSNINEELVFENTVLKNTKLKIENAEINDSFNATYRFCVNSECYDSIEAVTKKNDNTSILKLNGYVVLDENITSIKYNTLPKFINYFGKLKYKIGDVSKETKEITEIKIRNAKENEYYLEIPKEIKEANELYLEFNIRNKIYSYKLK